MEVNELVGRITLIAPVVRTISGTVAKSGSSEDESFTDGQVRYISKKLLTPFPTARAATARICLAHGVRFLSGYAIPDEKVGDVIKELTALGAEFNLKKTALISEWDRFVSEWVDSHPKVLPWVSRFPKAETAASTLSFSVAAYKVNPQHIETGLDEVKSEAKGLVGRVLEEIAQDVRNTWDPKGDKATQRIVAGLLKRVANKARTLSFLGGRLCEVAQFIEDTIASLPKDGAIVGRDFLVLDSLMRMLMDAHLLATAPLGIKVDDGTGDLFADSSTTTEDVTPTSAVESATDVSPVVTSLGTAESTATSDDVALTLEVKSASVVAAPVVTIVHQVAVIAEAKDDIDAPHSLITMKFAECSSESFAW